MDVEERRFEEILDRCVERLLDGEPLDQVLASYPGHAAQLLPVLRSATALLSAPAPAATAAARSAALGRMLQQVHASRASLAVPAAGVAGWLTSLRARPAAFQALAVAGAIVLFGGLGLGASAATGTTPEPVRDLLGMSSKQAILVELTGVITSVDGDVLTVDVDGQVRTVILGASTEITHGGDRIGASLLLVGDIVEVKGALQPDDSIAARRVQLEDREEPETTPAAPLAETPVAGDDDGDEEDGFHDDADDGAGPGGDSPGDGEDDADDGAGDGDDAHDEDDGAEDGVDEHDTAIPSRTPEYDDDGDDGHDGDSSGLDGDDAPDDDEEAEETDSHDGGDDPVSDDSSGSGDAVGEEPDSGD